MSHKSDITEGLRAVEARFERLAPGIDAYLEARLPTGTWTVHDCLCHIAADSHAVDDWQKRLDIILAGERPTLPGGIDTFNADNIAVRKDKPLAGVLDEVRAAFTHDLAAVQQLDDDLLAREIPYRGGIAPAAEMLRFYTGAHNTIHLDDIEQALAAAGSPIAATKQRVIGALRHVNERFETLSERIIAQVEAPLPTGTWYIRDALCHLAARSNGVPTFIARVERLARGEPMTAPGALNIDDINQSQIDARMGRPAEDLLREIIDGHKAAIEGVKQLDDALLDRQIKNPRGEGMIVTAELLLRSTVNHDNTHLDEIEQALQA